MNIRLTTALIAISLSNSLAQGVKSDTVFISKDTIDGYVHSIFFDPSRESKSYQSISSFLFGQFDHQTYKMSLDYLKEHNLTLVHSESAISWTKWVILKQYKGNFYAYKPCDFYSHFARSINDSTFIDWTGEGPVANKIVAQKKIDKKTYLFKLNGWWNQDHEIVIHIIDFEKGIAVFEQKAGGNSYYELMINADKIRSVPIIVNHCPYQKQIELEFEEPDFKKLLTGSEVNGQQKKR